MIPVSAITYIFVEKKKNSKTLGLKTNKTTSCLKLQNTAIHYAKDNVLYFEYSHTLRYSKCPIILNTLFHTKCTLAYICFLCSCFLNILWIDKQCRPCSEGSFRSSLIRVCTVCICHFVRNFGVQNFRSFTVILPQMIILCISTLHIDHSFPSTMLLTNFFKCPGNFLKGKHFVYYWMNLQNRINPHLFNNSSTYCNYTEELNILI